jgi:3-oxoadipate enol-lactonase
MEHKIFEQDGYDIHYYISENSSDNLIVFLHPAFGDHRCFDSQIDFFTENYRVMTLDMLGHGLSKIGSSKDKIDTSLNHIQKIMENEGYDKAHFVGVSMGSLIAQYVGLMEPALVKSITVVGGYDINSNNREVMNAQRNEGLKWIFKIIFSMNSFRRYAASRTVIHPEPQARFFEMTQLFTRKSLRVMPGLNSIIKNRENIKREYPLMVLSGDHDLELVRKVAEEWKSRDPGIFYHVIPEAGHCANMDNPEIFNQILYDFITSTYS